MSLVCCYVGGVHQKPGPPRDIGEGGGEVKGETGEVEGSSTVRISQDDIPFTGQPPKARIPQTRASINGPKYSSHRYIGNHCLS